MTAAVMTPTFGCGCFGVLELPLQGRGLGLQLLAARLLSFQAPASMNVQSCQELLPANCQHLVLQIRRVLTMLMDRVALGIWAVCLMPENHLEAPCQCLNMAKR